MDGFGAEPAVLFLADGVVVLVVTGLRLEVVYLGEEFFVDLGVLLGVLSKLWHGDRFYIPGYTSGQ